jgi:amino acid permease
MAQWNPKDEALHAADRPKNEVDAAATEAPEGGITHQGGRHVDLHRGLKARHITMIGMD